MGSMMTRPVTVTPCPCAAADARVAPGYAAPSRAPFFHSSHEDRIQNPVLFHNAYLVGGSDHRRIRFTVLHPHRQPRRLEHACVC